MINDSFFIIPGLIGILIKIAIVVFVVTSLLSIKKENKKINENLGKIIKLLENKEKYKDIE